MKTTLNTRMRLFQSTLKYQLCSVILSPILALTLFSCSNKSSDEQSPALCQRNVYSKNGVETVYHYSYDTKEGVVDDLSKHLITVNKYDSLGNLIYSKGNYPPAINGIDISTYHYEIRDELDLPFSTIYTYRMEYSDTTLTKASLFDEDGKYIARIEEYTDGNKVEDSVYVRDRLIYVSHIYKDSEGRDSVSLSYNTPINLYSLLSWNIFV